MEQPDSKLCLVEDVARLRAAASAAEIGMAQDELAALWRDVCATVGLLMELAEGGDGRILEACQLEDLSGQRLTKVGELLDAVRARLQCFASACGIADAIVAPAVWEHRREALHVSGPGLFGPELAQSAVDALFDS